MSAERNALSYPQALDDSAKPSIEAQQADQLHRYSGATLPIYSDGRVDIASCRRVSEDLNVVMTIQGGPLQAMTLMSADQARAIARELIAAAEHYDAERARVAS